MDPLSIAAGAAGLLSLGIQVTQSLVDFYSAYKTQFKDVERTITRLEALLGSLNTLSSALSASRVKRKLDDDVCKNIESSIDACNEDIHELDEACQKFRRKSGHIGFFDSAKQAARRVAYPFREGTLLTLSDSVQAVQGNIDFALSVLNLRTQSRIEAGIDRSEKLLRLIRDDQVSSEIRAWLNAADASIDYNAALAKRKDGTGLWLTESIGFKDWLKQKGSFLWLNGFAGCGKSVLCTTAIEATRDHVSSRPQSRIGLCFFYFTFNDSHKQNEAAMLKTLLLQLAGQSKDGSEDLVELWGTYKNASPPVPALERCLFKVIGRFEEVYILVDALDESPRGKTRESSLRVVNELRTKCSTSSHILVTSRDEVEIRRILSPSSDQDIEMQNEGINGDIKRFIDGYLEAHIYLRKRWAPYYDEIRISLAGRANGVFRWVECQLESLKHCVQSVRGLRECLKSLPDTLDETYERMLRDIDISKASMAKRLLTLLCYTPESLNVEQLIDALAVDMSEPAHFDSEARLLDADSLSDICPNLIRISPEERTLRLAEDMDPEERASFVSRRATVRIAHFSVKEYLESDRIRRSQAREYHMDLHRDKGDLLDVCLIYFLNNDFHEAVIEAFEAPKTKSKMSRAISYHMVLEAYPFARFAARNWHVFMTDPTAIPLPKLCQILRIFDNNNRTVFENWARFGPISNYTDFNCSVYDDIEVPHWWPICCAAYLGLSQVVSELSPKYQGIMVPKGSHCCCQKSWLDTSLRAAAFGGHLDIVRALLDEGANIDARCIIYGTPIVAASYAGHNEVVEFLEKRGANLDLGGTKYSGSLQAAVARGQLGIIAFLLQRGADAKASGTGPGCALLTASEQGNVEAARMLIDAGAEIDICNEEGHSALQLTSRRGNLPLVELLIRKGADVNAGGGICYSPLISASLAGDVSIIKLLIENGASLNATGGYWHTPLQAATFGGHLHAVKFFIEKGADVNASGGHFHTPLQAACRHCNYPIARLLIEKGADVNVSGGEWHTPLLAALGYHPDLHCIELLLENGADVDAQHEFLGNALQLAAAGCPTFADYEPYSTVKLLLDKGASVNAQCGRYGSALAAATSNGDQQTVKLLVEHGADVNLVADGYFSALHFAAFGGHVPIVEFLLEKGADLSTQNRFLGTALHVAAYFGFEEMVRLFLKKGVDVEVRGGIYEQVILAAAHSGSDQLVSLLVEHGADIGALGGDFGNALQAAARSDSIETMKLLLKKGIDVNIRGGKLHTALQAACYYQCRKVIRLLLENGADVNLEGGACRSAFNAAIRGFPKNRTSGATLQEIHDTAIQIAEELAMECKWNDLRLCEDLRCALESEDPAFSEILIQIGADMSQEDELGRTPIHGQLHYRNIELIKTREAWMNVITSKRADTAGLTVLHHVSCSLSSRACAWAIGLCDSVEPVDNQSWTPLHWAAYFGRNANVKALLDAGADSGRRTNCGLSPLDLAIRYGNQETAKYLSETADEDWKAYHQGLSGKGDAPTEKIRHTFMLYRFGYEYIPYQCGYCGHSLNGGMEDYQCEDCDVFQGFHLCFRCFKDVSRIDPNHEYVRQIRSPDPERISD